MAFLGAVYTRFVSRPLPLPWPSLWHRSCLGKAEALVGLVFAKGNPKAETLGHRVHRGILADDAKVLRCHLYE